MLNALHFHPIAVSTHSRPKAAALIRARYSTACKVSTHSRPKAAARTRDAERESARFNSQPPEGGCLNGVTMGIAPRKFQLTAARRQLPIARYSLQAGNTFQLTAARRQLHLHAILTSEGITVSTHSRPKAAALATPVTSIRIYRFNSQPPEGSCSCWLIIKNRSA